MSLLPDRSLQVRHCDDGRHCAAQQRDDVRYCAAQQRDDVRQCAAQQHDDVDPTLGVALEEESGLDVLLQGFVAGHVAVLLRDV